MTPCQISIFVFDVNFAHFDNFLCFLFIVWFSIFIWDFQSYIGSIEVASEHQRVSVTCLWFPRFLGSDLNGRSRRDGRLSSSRYPREKRELETYANHHSMSTRRAEMIKMINPADSGFDSGSSPEFFNQQNDEGPMSRTAQYRKVS